jgi:two-component system, chemotaxis family, sensor kinase CheA
MSLDQAKQTFVIEARELLRDMEQQLLDLERMQDKDTIDAVFRCAHTIKGSAGIFGFDPIVDFTHVVEGVLGDVRRGRATLDRDLTALLLSCADHIGALVERVADQGKDPDAPMRRQGDALLGRLRQYTDVAAAAADPDAAAERAGGHVANWRISLRFGPDVLRHGTDPLSLLRYLTTLGEIANVKTSLDAMPAAAAMDPQSCYVRLELDFKSSAEKQTIADAFEFVREECEVRILPGETADELSESQKQAGGTKQQERRLIQVQADKLDHLINLVGELVIAGAGAAMLASRAKDITLTEAVSSVNRLVDEIRGSSLQLRMVPIGDTFTRFKRVVHDLNRELGKDIELVVSGTDTELDKMVIERIGDSLTHLVRNAVDHGIEPRERRLALGKPATGTLRLNAFHDSGYIVIEVADDGAGLNRAAILAQARANGLIGAEQAPTEHEIDHLIFQAGFSTAERVTNLSGRGVGMDVVRRSVEALRGTIEIESQEGAGTTFRIRLPLTLAIIEGFLMGVGNTSYVVPLDTVVECVEVDERFAARGHDYINLRGEVLPFLRLREQFRETGGTSRRENIVVVQYAGHKAGLVVDKLLGEFQTVIRPLGKIFSNVQGISGTTILGSGEVALILDVPSLIHHVTTVQQNAARH